MGDFLLNFEENNEFNIFGIKLPVTYQNVQKVKHCQYFPDLLCVIIRSFHRKNSYTGPERWLLCIAELGNYFILLYQVFRNFLARSSGKKQHSTS